MPGTVIEADFRTVPPEPPSAATFDLRDGQEVKLPSGESAFVRLWSRAQLDERGRQLAAAVNELAEDVERGGDRVSAAFRKSWSEWRPAVSEDLAGGPTLAVLERQEGVLTGFRGILRRQLAAAAPPAAAARPAAGPSENKGWPWYVVLPAGGAAVYGIVKGVQWVAAKFFDATTQSIPTPHEEARDVGTH